MLQSYAHLCIAHWIHVSCCIPLETAESTIYQNHRFCPVGSRPRGSESLKSRIRSETFDSTGLSGTQTALPYGLETVTGRIQFLPLNLLKSWHVCFLPFFPGRMFNYYAAVLRSYYDILHQVEKKKELTGTSAKIFVFQMSV